MNTSEARAAIEAILAAIDDDYLAEPNKYEVGADGKVLAWYGSHVRVLGSAKRGGDRYPLLYREDAARNAVEGEMFYRLDKRFHDAGDDPAALGIAQKASA